MHAPFGAGTEDHTVVYLEVSGSGAVAGWGGARARTPGRGCGRRDKAPRLDGARRF